MATIIRLNTLIGNRPLLVNMDHVVNILEITENGKTFSILTFTKGALHHSTEFKQTQEEIEQLIQQVK